MGDIAARVHSALTAQGVVVESVSIGAASDRTTWLVHPSSEQTAAQPIIDAFVEPTPQQLADEQATREADLQILRAIVIELHAIVPTPKPTLAQLRSNIITRYKALTT